MSVTVAENSPGKCVWKNIFFGALVTLYGIFLLEQTAVNLTRFYKARLWQETSCTILKIESEHETGTKPPMNQKVKVLYSFEYAGKKYTGDQYDIVYTLYSEAEIEDLIAEHPPNAQTGCYFNPHDPRESAINREVGIGKFIVYFALLIFIFGIALMLLRDSFPRRKDRLLFSK